MTPIFRDILNGIQRAALLLTTLGPDPLPTVAKQAARSEPDPPELSRYELAHHAHALKSLRSDMDMFKAKITNTLYDWNHIDHLKAHAEDLLAALDACIESTGTAEEGLRFP